jgi:autophagy-related protein 11
MSLNIYIAHTGEHLLADPVSFASPDALRTWIARHTSIPAQRQILMTARGKNVRIQSLATEVR